MVFDPRDELWNATYNTYYDSYYEEIAADTIINRWQLVDEYTKVLVALTVSGSAVSGWSLWSNPRFKIIWIILAGLGAVLAIVHSALGVPGRLKDWGESKRWFAMLRIDMETFMYRMRVNPDFSVDDFTNDFVEYRRRFGEGHQRIKNDILWKKGLEFKAQKELDKRLKKNISSQ
jgi:hypothetical protein